MEKRIDKDRLVKFIIVAWSVFSLLISTEISSEVYNGRIFHTAISFILLSSAVWIIYLHHWILNSKVFSPIFSILYCLIAITGVSIFIENLNAYEQGNLKYKALFLMPIIHLYLSQKSFTDCKIKLLNILFKSKIGKRVLLVACIILSFTMVISIVRGHIPQVKKYSNVGPAESNKYDDIIAEVLQKDKSEEENESLTNAERNKRRIESLRKLRTR